MSGQPGLEIVELSASPRILAALGDLLVETVAAGGSVSFMHPLAPDVAVAFWSQSLAAAEAGGRVVLGALEDGELVGTVTVHLDCPPNQPHRGEIAKMMTRVNRRGRGIARTLMLEAERLAGERGRTLLTLDTAEEQGAGPFYEKLGFVKAGVIPQYAFKPHGGLCGTIIYWKRLAMPPPAANVDEYIAAQSAEVQPRLRELRAIIRAAVPDATEVIAYAIPTYRFNGRMVSFGAAKRHCALYGSAMDAFADELKGFDTSKGTVRFPLERPLPEELVRQLVTAKLLG